MARRVYLHIGTMKSATTYLQQWGDLNRETLAAAGVLWPELGLPFAATNDLLGKTGARRETEGAWAELDRLLRRHHGAAVVSNELLAMLAPRRIARLVSGFAPAEVHVVVTARDLARVIPSQWQTRLKNGSMLTWAEFAAAICTDPGRPPGRSEPVEPSGDPAEWFWRRQDLPAIVRKWQQVVGDRLTVVTVPPAGSSPHVVAARFATAIGLGDHAFAQPAYLNSSVGAHSAELIRRVNSHPAGLEGEYQRMGVRNALARLVLAQRASAEPRCGLSAEQLAWAHNRARIMVRELEQLAVQVVGELDDLIPGPETTDGGIDPARANDADLLEAAVFGLAGMARVQTDVRLELSQLRRDHEELLLAHQRLLRETARERS